jgi:16S rRNA processing protein RimM
MSDIPNDIIPMGRVLGAFGILGWVKIKSDTQNPDSLAEYSYIYCLTNDIWMKYKISKFMLRGDVCCVKLDKIDDRDQAQKLRGLTIGVPRSNFPKLDTNEYYCADLIGMMVINQDNIELGVIRDFLTAGGSSVMCINKADNKELLIPFIKQYVQTVKIDDKLVIVDWGLDYLA